MFWRPSVDELIQCNTLGFFLAAFDIPLKCLRSQWPSLPAQATPISCVDKSLVKSLRDHLHKKEMLRWHPDHFNKRLTPEREVACMNGRMRIKERAVARVIGETLTTLKKECEKALNTEQSFGSKCFI